MSIEISLEAKNIGIHENLQAELKLDSAKLAIYATNGSGKTCLSRAFRLYAKASIGEATTADLTDTLHFDHSTGMFRFGVRDSKTKEQFGFELQLDSSKGVTISQRSKYRFHVFNRDYVTENVERNNFAPEGTIEGIILGKENIDVSTEEKRLASLHEKRNGLLNELENAVSDAKEELAKLGLSRNLAAFKQLTVQNLIDGATEDVIEDYGTLKSQFEKLGEMPDDLPNPVNFTSIQGEDVVEAIRDILNTRHTRNSFADEFKARIIEKVDFIREGLEFIDQSVCPFCEQVFAEPEFELIDKYNQFLNDEEAKVIATTTDYAKRLEKLRLDGNEMYRQYLQCKIDVGAIQQFLPSTRGFALSELEDMGLLTSAFSALADSLTQKAKDISNSFGAEAEASLDSISRFFQNAVIVENANQTVVDKINSKKTNIASERLQLRKTLCLAKLETAREVSKHSLEQLQSLSKDISDLEQDIKGKLHKNKKERKDEVVRTLKEALYHFFGDKFSFDEQKFCLTLREKRLSHNAHSVLSDGEKSIVAFCHYLATTHCLVNDDADYDNLFFVIDDPISSMDFHFVYAVGQSIRTLHSQFGLERARFIILTHNLEFISYLQRNLIANNVFVLAGNGIQRLDKGSMLPYEAHLRDILKVSEGMAVPSHTTPNSLRHVLEVVAKWLAPKRGFEAFYEGVESFRSSAYLWQLIQDQSHGAPRTERTHTPEMVREACALVIAFMREKGLGGQLDDGN